MSQKSLVRTRMAPSPTGVMHVGSLATLLKNYALAKKHNGAFILRIEDTDQERLVPGALEAILSVIRAYGLSWDEGPEVGGPHDPYVQSQRLDLYTEAVQTLIKNDQAYYCFCSKERLEELKQSQHAAKQPPKYDRLCRTLSQEEVKKRLDKNEPYVVRLKVPDQEEVVFTDLIRGEISFSSNEINDQVLLKSDGFPTYHLAVVVDDHEMEITHVLRGEEWISSTPKHILLYKAFGWEVPLYAHIPVFLNPDGKGKMSKRKGDVAAQSFLDKGYLPEAMLNFFMILGWTPQDQREILTLDEYIAEFDPKDISAGSVAFDIKKLDWLNGMYIRRLENDELSKRLRPFIPSEFPQEQLLSVLPLIKERLVRLSDFTDLTSFFYQSISPDLADLLKKSEAATVIDQLDQTIRLLDAAADWEVETIEQGVRNLQADYNWKKGQYFMMLRIAVTGRQQTPPLFETMAAIGKEVVLERLEQAQKLVYNN